MLQYHHKGDMFPPKQPKENTEKITNLMIYLECLTAIPCSSNN